MPSGVENTDALIRHVGGCNRFQWVLTTFAFLTYMASSFTMIFMSFGMYNPGWRCQENTTSTRNSTLTIHNTVQRTKSFFDNNVTILVENTGKNPRFNNGFSETCVGFQECDVVQFRQEESTVVTEWGLICEGAWKVSTITSTQMAGTTVGYFISGYLGDAFGRKLTMGINLFAQGILTIVSVVSVSWEMFAVLKFFIGITCGVIQCVSVVYATEFVTPKWRVIISSLPMWALGCAVFSLCAIALKDWRYIHIVDAVFTILLLIPAYIFPESLRWLIINKKEKKADRAVEQMVELNKTGISGDLNLMGLANQGGSQKIKSTTIYSVIRLFEKGTIINTLTLSLMLFEINLLYFSSSFGVTLLPGNLYFNNLILYLTELPASFISFFAPNVFGRRPTGFVFTLFQGVFLAVFLALDVFSNGVVRDTGMLISIIVARNFCCANWFVSITCAGELFPTTIRATAMGWMMFVSGIAAAISPYLVINSDIMRISYLVIVVLSLGSCFMFFLIPETLGKDLRDDTTSCAVDISGTQATLTATHSDDTDGDSEPMVTKI